MPFWKLFEVKGYLPSLYPGFLFEYGQTTGLETVLLSSEILKHYK
jgi:hypothetical protein